VDIELKYGRTGCRLSLPDHLEVLVIRKKPMPVVADAQAAVAAALTSPVQSPTLEKLAQGCRSACLAICDLTRPVPNGLILPTLVDRLTAAGLDPARITILVATGLHRPNEGRELEELVGSRRVLEKVSVVNHFARHDHDHVDLGATRRGSPILLDRRFVEADLRLAVGLVEPHFMAGYSGGRKVIVPGLAHARTITRIHTAEFLEDRRAANCILDCNPLHDEQMEMVSRLGPLYGVNTVIDEERRLCFVNFGDLAAGHLAAVEFVRPYAEIPIPRQYPTVITSAAGYPLDATYYQTIKGMVGAMSALAPGGRLFIASACSQGLGSPEFAAAQARLVGQGPENFLKSLVGKSHADIDEWQTEMQLKPMRLGRIFLYTQGLNPEQAALTGVTMVPSLENAVQDWIKETGDQRVAVIPEGPYVIPRFQN
jgi:nickel-dependent lactate racemase